jgi:hypothetical protein
MKLPRRALVILMMTLMLRPSLASGAVAYGLGAGGGPILSCHVSAAGADEHHDCTRGVRGELNLNLLSFERRGDGGGFREPGSRSSGGSGSWGGTSWVSGGNDLIVLLAVVVAILVLYGIFWGLVALFSSSMTFALYASSDRLTDDHGALSRYGFQLSFYPAASAWLRVHMGTGPASFHPPGGDAEHGRYLEGLSSRIGLGIVPPPGRDGPYVLLEGEYASLSTSTFADLFRRSGIEATGDARYTEAVAEGRAVVIGQRLMDPFLSESHIRWDSAFAANANRGEPALDGELEAGFQEAAGSKMRG